MKVDVSAVIVNFQSADYTVGAVDTLLNDHFTIDGRRGEIEIIVVDNASRGDDISRLLPIAHGRVRLIRNTENVGYALANNEGFHASTGTYHLVVNPDVRIVPGCLQRLIDALHAHPHAGIVGPLAAMDEEESVLLPPNELPDPYREALNGLVRMSPEVARFNARRRARFAHRYWVAREPIEVEMLSGGCFLGRREIFQKHGLFDGGFPLYYEDTDLFRRFRDHGLALIHVPAARVIHFFSRSAITRMKAAMYRHDVSARRYFTRWFGPLGLRVHDVARARGDAAGRSHLAPWPLTGIGPTLDAPVLDVPAIAGAYIEVAGNPQFTLAVGIFPERAGAFRIPGSFFEQLGHGQYWMRTVDPATGDAVRAWQVAKGVPD